jgi:hypothetical protein
MYELCGTTSFYDVIWRYTIHDLYPWTSLVRSKYTTSSNLLRCDIRKQMTQAVSLFVKIKIINILIHVKKNDNISQLFTDTEG